MPIHDLSSALIIFVAFVLGGVLKGATGAGTPVVAVPVMAAFFDIRIAVAIMVTPNLLTNINQIFKFRAHHLPERFALFFAIAGAVGAGVGTVMLVYLPARVLTLLVAGAVVLYITLRLLRPDFKLEFALARRIVLPAGFIAGMLQGAVGISAPVSVSFLNAMRLARPVFIVTISGFFFAMSSVQIPMLAAYGVMTWTLLGLGIAAMIPLWIGMPIGEWLAKRMSAQAFDRLVLVFLGVMALRLIWTALI